MMQHQAAISTVQRALVSVRATIKWESIQVGANIYHQGTRLLSLKSTLLPFCKHRPEPRI